MTEITIPLKLPIRRIVATNLSAGSPAGLADQFQRLRQMLDQAAHWTGDSSPLSGEPTPREQELAELRKQRAVLDHLTAQLRQTVRVLHEKVDQLLPEIQHATVELAHAIAAKLVLDLFAADQFPIENLVREVVARLQTQEPVVVRLHPDDLAVWRQERPGAVATSQDAELRVIADASLSRGDCTATAGEITVVYELRRQVEEIRRQLLSAVDGHARNEP